MLLPPIKKPTINKYRGLPGLISFLASANQTNRYDYLRIIKTTRIKLSNDDVGSNLVPFNIT